MAELRKYGEAATINFELFEVDGVDFRVDAVHASGDTTIMKDEGAEANTTNSFTDEGNGYSLVLTATEMQAARVVIYVVDQTATKVWLDRTIKIETYGNASAQHAFDLDTAMASQTVGTVTNQVTADVTAISGDSTAADNLELDYDGTGYNKSNSTIGTTTTNTDMRGTDSALLAASAPTNWSSMVITAGGAVDSLVQGFLNTLITESTAGRIAGNFDTWFDNADAATIATLDDITAILADTNELQSDDIPGLIAALNDISTAQVNAEVLDVLNVDTFSQPGQGTPAATQTIVTMIAFLYKAWRNRSTQTAIEYDLFNDDATTVDQKATFSDDTTTADTGEVVTGP